MLMNPPILFADEPTSALDVSVQRQVVREMLKLRELFGTAIVIVTHGYRGSPGNGRYCVGFEKWKNSRIWHSRPCTGSSPGSVYQEIAGRLYQSCKEGQSMSILLEAEHLTKIIYPERKKSF